MKALFVISLLAIFTSTAGQAQDGSEFDFWVGRWELTWEYGDGTKGNGTNNIVKTLDDKVIQEHFKATDSGPYQGFKGTSISVFNPNLKTWHQAWADNQGGFFNFTGEIDGDRRIFKTTPYQRGSEEVILRMVFYKISRDSITWDWEQSKDGGKTWALQWRIHYKRAV